MEDCGYGFYQINDLSREQFMSKVNQVAVFELIFNQPVVVGKKYKSIFRVDKHPTCHFSYFNGILLFVDLGDTRHTHRSCIRAVMDYFSPPITMAQAMQFIIDNIKGVMSNNNIILPHEDKTEIENIVPFNIEYTRKQFSSSDRRYWNKFLISEDDLLQDKVYPISKFSWVKNNIRKVKYVYSLGYAITFCTKTKVYRPYSLLKFFSNCCADDIGNFDNISANGERLIISKSYKDHRVLRNLLSTDDVVWFMNEGVIPSEYLLVSMIKRFREIIIFFDTDVPGYRAAYRLEKTFIRLAKENNIVTTVRRVNIPITHSSKDIAEYVEREGRHDTTLLLKHLNLYYE